MGLEWLLFLALIATLLWLDLGVTNKTEHEIDVPEALRQSACWIGVSAVVGCVVWFTLGSSRGAEFFTAYIIEKSLSVDNLFVFLAIFSYFKIEAKYQHRVLYWGILGALVLRFVAITGGVVLLHIFHPLMYVFGAILVYTAWKVSFCEGADDVEHDQTPFARFIREKFWIDLSDEHKGKFSYVQWNGVKPVRWFTKLFFVLCIIEATDLLFATDSIPAALACSDNAFVIFSSNIMAVLGLRSLYFALSALMGKFEYLKYGVSAVLALIGIKMLIADYFVAPTFLWLIMVAILLSTSIIASVISSKQVKENVNG